MNFKTETQKIGIQLPELGKYGTGFVFFPQDENKRNSVNNS
jgi:glutamate synthase domain-containing protein 1